MRLLPLLLLSTLALACSADNTTISSAPINAETSYWTLRLNYHAVNLALTPPYDTVRLIATPLNALGKPLASHGHIVWRTVDSTVSVDSMGLLTAHGVIDRDLIIVSMQDPQQRVTNADTVVVQVVSTPPPLPLTFSIQPIPGDSAKRAIAHAPPFLFTTHIDTSFISWPVRVTDARGDTVCGAAVCAMLVQVATSNQHIVFANGVAEGNAIELQQKDTGNVIVSATAYAYGKVVADSVAFRVGYSLFVNVTIQTDTPITADPALRFSQFNIPMAVGFVAPRVATLSVGGILQWGEVGIPNKKYFDIQFDDPTAADTATCTVLRSQIPVPALVPHTYPPNGSGNIAPFGGDTASRVQKFYTNLGVPWTLVYANEAADDCASRRFLVPGVYHWHSSLLTPTETFTLIVKREEQPTLSQLRH